MTNTKSKRNEKKKRPTKAKRGKLIQRERAATRKGGEFFYLDKDGKPTDAGLHEEMLAIDPAAEKRILEATKARVREHGLSEEAIALLYPDP
jgi:hypothetical protein